MKNKKLEEIIEKYDLVGKTECAIKRLAPCYSSINILEYINLHYALPKSAITELSKDENVREILVKYGLVEEVNKTLLPNVWNFVESKSGFKYAILGNSKNSKNEYNGLFYDYFRRKFYSDRSIINDNQIESIRLMTPQEIEAMLIKKLEADGLKVGCMVERSWFTDTPIIKNYNFKYNEVHDVLTCNDKEVYRKGKFAEIIQLELSDSEKIKIMWDKFNSK